jgi:ligand-binding sensor domain-containing protein
MIPKYLLSCVVVIAILCSTGFAQPAYRFQHFTSKDGLADNFVFSIEQDSLGFMWFQYWGGLTRYDGYNFKIYKRDKDNPRTATLDFGLGRMALDHRKKLWISKHQFPQRPPFVAAKYNYHTDGFIKYSVDLGNVVIAPTNEDESVLWLGAFFGKGLFSVTDDDSISNYVNWAESHMDTLARNSIFYIKDNNSSLMLATTKGLWNFDKTKKVFSRPKCNPKDSSLLYNTWFSHMVEKGNQFWGVETTMEYNGAPSAIVKLSPDLSIIDRKELVGYNISSIDFDQNGVAWIGTWTNGLFRYDYKDGSLIHITNVPDDPYSLTTNTINDVCVDQNQNVWIATHNGVSKLYRNSIDAIELKTPPGRSALFNSKSREFLITAVGTDNFPLNSFELSQAELPRTKGVTKPSRKLKGTLNAVEITELLQGKRRLWISTYPTGVYYYPIDPQTGLVMDMEPTLLGAKGGDPNAIGINGISSMLEDNEGNLWIGGQGLHKIIASATYGADGSVKTYSHNEADTNSISGQTIFHLYAEDDQSLWVATNGGLDLFHKTTGVFEHVIKDPGFVTSIYRRSDGSLLAGTIQGVYNLSKDNGHYRLSAAPIWGGGDVAFMLEDTIGRLWMRTAVGVVCYDYKQKLKIPLTESDGIFYKKSINPGLFDKTSDGKMLLIEDGILIFDPLTLSLEQNKPKVVLTGLEVNNQVPAIGRPQDATIFNVKSHISVLEQLVVDHLHNNFGIEFSALEMTAPERNLYQHKLQGYDNEWIQTDYKNRRATYTNLDPGDYLFRVKASNRHGIWSDVETTLKIKVLPPPWKSNWAYTDTVFSLSDYFMVHEKQLSTRTPQIKSQACKSGARERTFRTRKGQGGR